MPVLRDLPGTARVWIHPTATPLSTSTQTAFREQLDAFVDTWTSHQQAVRGASVVLYDRFVLLAGILEDGTTPSGCAIDEASRAIDNVADALNVDWVPSLYVMYRADDGSVVSVPRQTFQERVDTGTVTADTPVFDPSVTTLRAVRAGSFKQPAGESWHAEAFSVQAPA